MSQVSYGTITIVDTTDIGRIYMIYAKSVSNTTPPSDELTWSESIASAPGEGDFIWQKTVVEKAITEEKTYSDPVCVTGSSGQGVEKIINYYCNYGQGQPEEDYSGWQLEIPEYDGNKPNYWTKVVVIYSDDTREDFQASGAIATFESEKVGILDSLEVTLNPKQSGSGTPSPSNVRPISGWDEVETNVAGVNLFDKTTVFDGYIENTDGVYHESVGYKCIDYIKINGGDSYYIVSEQTASKWGAWYDKDKAYISGLTGYGGNAITAPNNAMYMRLTIANNATGDVNTFAVNYPSTDTEYHPYQGHTYTTDLPQTVYGGTLDVVSGVLTVDRAMITIDGTNYNMAMSGGSKRCYISDLSVPKAKPSPNTHTPAPNLIANYLTAVGDAEAYSGAVGVCIYATESANIGFTLTGEVMTFAEVKSYLASNPLQVCYELAEPQTYQLTPTEVNTLIGDNNVWGGDTVEVRGHTISKRDVMIYKDNGLTDVVDKSAEANTNAAEALERVKKIWSNSTGSYMASGIGTNEVDIDDSSTYGFNSKSTTTGVSFNYNTIPLTSLGTDGLKLYSPTLTNGVITGSRLDATLTSWGLKLLKGGIESGNLSSGNGYVYLSTEDKTGITINGHTPGTNDPKWRAIIGSKFGVDSEGNLYASSANIQGILTAGAGSTVGPWSITATSIYKGSATHGAAGSGNMYFGDNGLSISNTFKVSSAGVLNATGAKISGNLTATDGFTVTQNNKTLTSITTNGMIVYDGVGSTNSNIVAKFTSDGAQMGQMSGAHSVIDTNGQRFYASDGTTQLANIGYGLGIDSDGETSDAPYYSLGLRTIATTQYNPSATYNVGDVCLYDGKTYACKTKIDTPEAWTQDHWIYSIGNYSITQGYDTIAAGFASHAEGSWTFASGGQSHAEGYDTTASGNYSHAEGFRTTASDNYSHAEGLYTTASGWDAHAEGESTTASNYDAHAEGNGTIASGWISHAGGEGTIAQRKSQYAIGAYNIADNGGASVVYRGDYVFIIGNGTSDTARSNALTVDWSGNVQSYSQIADSSKTSYDAYNYSHNYAIIDKTGNTIGAVGNHIYANGAIGSFLTAGRTISGTKKWNSISVNIDNSGNRFYGITDPRAFCSALDLGETLSHEPAAITCTTGKYMQLAYFTVTPGTWLLMGSGQFPYVNTTGIRRIYMSTATSGYNNVTTGPASLAMQLYNNAAPISGNIPTYVNSGPMPITFTSNTIVRLIGFQNSGSNISVTGRIYAVRLA